MQWLPDRGTARPKVPRKFLLEMRVPRAALDKRAAPRAAQKPAKDAEAVAGGAAPSPLRLYTRRRCAAARVSHNEGCFRVELQGGLKGSGK